MVAETGDAMSTKKFRSHLYGVSIPYMDVRSDAFKSGALIRSEYEFRYSDERPTPLRVIAAKDFKITHGGATIKKGTQGPIVDSRSFERLCFQKDWWGSSASVIGPFVDTLENVYLDGSFLRGGSLLRNTSPLVIKDSHMHGSTIVGSGINMLTSVLSHSVITGSGIRIANASIINSNSLALGVGSVIKDSTLINCWVERPNGPNNLYSNVLPRIEVRNAHMGHCSFEGQGRISVQRGAWSQCVFVHHDPDNWMNVKFPQDSALKEAHDLLIESSLKREIDIKEILIRQAM